MAQLFAIVYESPAKAEAALAECRRLQQGHAIQLADAVIVERGADGEVRLRQSVNMASLGALSGAFWGSVVGLLFLNPLAGAAIGAAAGGLGGYATDYGIDDAFMKDLGGRLAPGQAALFLLSAQVTPDRVAEALRPHGGEVLYTSVARETEAAFARVLSGGGAAPVAPAPAPSAGQTAVMIENTSVLGAEPGAARTPG